MKCFYIIFNLVIVWKTIESQEEIHWSYTGATGPYNWCYIVDTCCGLYQSPINLPNSRYVNYVNKLIFDEYDVTPSSMSIENSGHTVIIRITSNDVTPTVSGGNLKGSYIFSSLHFHWGDDNSHGSEHSIRGQWAPLEVHLVHYSSRFNSLEDAVASDEHGALAVIGVLFNTPDDYYYYPKSFVPVAKAIPSVQFEGQKSDSLTPFPLKRMLPVNTNYFFQYLGSLTTPSCNEVVAWTVFDSIGFISWDQLNSLRTLYVTTKDASYPERMVNNYRPLQRINNRKISFNLGKY